MTGWAITAQPVAPFQSNLTSASTAIWNWHVTLFMPFRDGFMNDLKAAVQSLGNLVDGQILMPVRHNLCLKLVRLTSVL